MKCNFIFMLIHFPGNSAINIYVLEKKNEFLGKNNHKKMWAFNNYYTVIVN